MKLLIVNGPNLNLVGRREPEIYGGEDLESYLCRLSEECAARGVEVSFVHSNVEGELVNFVQSAADGFDGIILNAGGYTHTSVALADAVRAVGVPAVEVHISNVFAREEYRHTSLTGAACRGAILGFGLDSYRLAVESFLLPDWPGDGRR